MDNLKQAVSNVVDKVEEAVGVKPEEPKVVEPVISESVEAPVKEEKAEDRSAYNCPDCKGEGLRKGSLGELVNCATCNNTGKV